MMSLLAAARALSARRHFSDQLLPERSESRAKLGGKELRLFPGGEVTALCDSIVIDQLGIRPLRPVPWGLIELVREDAYANRNGDALGTEKGELILPIEASR